ncbi:MAG: aryl-sulfate sulfotransferase, partial [Saprospiraceae bacterium]|nr:aryl-sulfate sulfotransferase [Saprospiraceae bacterium]
TRRLRGYGFHHHVIEKPNGNFLVTVNDFSKSTVEDVVIEIDRNSGNIINTWDLNESLEKGRQAWETDIADLNVDWFHANALEYSPTDDCILVSGRTQGVVKLDVNNEVKWILAPHKDWDLNGRGQD